MAGRQRMLCFVIGGLILTVAEDRDAECQAYALIEAIPDLAAEGIVAAGEMSCANTCVHREAGQEGAFRPLDIQLGHLNRLLATLHDRHHRQGGVVDGLFVR